VACAVIARPDGRDPVKTLAGLAALRPGASPAAWTAGRTRLLELLLLLEARGLPPASAAVSEALASPIDPRREVRLIDLGIALQTRGEPDAALSIYRLVAQRQPRQPPAEEALARLAAHAERRKDAAAGDSGAARTAAAGEAADALEAVAAGEAADALEQLALSFPASDRAPDALLNAARLRAGLHQDAAAARDLERYARGYPGRPDAGQRMLEAARGHHAANADRDAVRLLQEYERRYTPRDGDGALEARWLEIDALDRLGRGNEARALEAGADVLYARVRTLPTCTARGVGWYARIRYGVIDRLARELRAVRIEGSPAEAKARLRQWQDGVAAIDALLPSLIALGDRTWSLAGLVAAGEAYEAFAAALEATVPVSAVGAPSISGESSRQPLEAPGISGESSRQPGEAPGISGESSRQPREAPGISGESSRQPLEAPLITPLRARARSSYDRVRDLAASWQVRNAWSDRACARLVALEADTRGCPIE
jgi:hypothetical protein